MKSPARLLVVAWILVLTGMWRCGGSEGLPGRYGAELPGEDPPRVAALEFHENGQGTWKISGDQVPFKWEVRGKEIRLHTREGGVVTGAYEGSAVHLRLPGLPPTTFQRLSR